MSDERYYKVTVPVEMMIRADDSDQAVDIAVEAVGHAVGGTVRTVFTDQAYISVERVEHDPEGLAEVERLLTEVSTTRLTHPFTD